MRSGGVAIATGLGIALTGVLVLAQFDMPTGPAFRLARDHPAIEYSKRPTRDAIVRLNERLDKGEIALDFEARPRGYLQSVLKALDISPSSQALVFSESSLQREHITKRTPRAIYFNDTAAVAWSNGAESMEVAVLDATQGVQFYSLRQAAQQKPRFAKRNDCLQCHLMPHVTEGVPGFFTMSQLPLSDNQLDYAQGWPVDHRTPIEDRWGGWYVTGTQVPKVHLGNVAVSHVPKSYVRADVAPVLDSVTKVVDSAPYLTPQSDVVALFVLNHQLHMSNLLIRLGWEARVAAAEKGAPRSKLPDVTATADEVVDYMLFADEAPLPSPVRGAGVFAKEFAAKGPRDKKGRSLRDIDLTQRTFRYPLSYMIYSETFDALPDAAKNLVYQRLWVVLAGKSSDKRFASIAPADRQAILEILRDTKTGMPAYFTP